MMARVLDRYLRPSLEVVASAQALLAAARTLATTWRATPRAQALPAALGLDVSDECNLACAVCSRTLARDPRATPLLELPKFKAVCDAVRPAYLLLSGYGEPLLNPDLPAMVDHARSLGARTCVITNGTLLGSEAGRKLAAAGPHKLKVSLDAASADRYARLRRGGDLEALLAGLRAFLVRAPETMVELQLVLCRENIDELKPLVELSRQIRGARPSFLLAFTYGDPASFGRMALPRAMPEDPAVIQALGSILQAKALCRRWGLRQAAAQLDDIALQLQQDLSRAPCFMPWYQTLVATDGRLFPCCHHSIHGAACGDVFSTPFAEVWNGPAMLDFRQRLLNDRAAHPVCAGCGHQDMALQRAFRLTGRGWLRRGAAP